MIFLYILCLLLLFGIGFLLLIKPESMLRLQDIFRLRGQREYTDLAILGARFTGIILIIGGILFVFLMVDLMALQ